jgi:hypothetical protein
MGPVFIALVSMSSMAMVAIIVWLAQREKQARIDSQRDVQLALLGKFSSGEEMSKFLASTEGRLLVNQLANSGQDDPRRMTVGLLVGGLVLLALGGGFFIASMRTEALMIPGIFFLALAIGLLLAAGATHVVSKRLGLVPGVGEGDQSGS